MKFQNIVTLFICTGLFFISWNATAQLNTNGNTNNALSGENPFVDASEFVDFPNSIGKGLVYPRTDLTTWVFNTTNLDGTTFPTAFDGMVVYNTGTGQTTLGEGVQVTVSPGFYYFFNPGATDNIASGQWQSMSSEGKFVDGTNTIDAVFLGGNVGIGLQVPTEKLEVAGTIYASGGGAILTDTGVYADYVFENYTEGFSEINKDYSFKTLEEVDAFVKINKHLPGVTGIDELKKTEHGYVVNITTLSGQLLEKVEELFLYTIAQEKTIEALQEKLTLLKAQQEQLNAKDINFSKLPIYKNDKYAALGGLTTGNLYRTDTGFLLIKM